MRSTEAAGRNRDLAYRNRYPDFTVGVSPIQYQNAVKEWEVMVEFNLPLRQDSRRAQEREAEARLAAREARQAAMANLLQGELHDNLSGLEVARRQAQRLESSLIPQAEATFSAALAGYENNRVDFATLLEAERQLRQARLNRLKAQVEALARLAEVERLLGEPL